MLNHSGTVFTDLDGTLIRDLNPEAWRHVIGQPLPFSMHLITSEGVAAELEKLRLLGSCTKEEAVAKKRALMRQWYESLPAEELLFEDSHHFLTELKRDGHAIYLVTSKNAELTHFTLARFSLSSYFEAVHSGLTSKRRVIENANDKARRYFVTDSPVEIEECRDVEGLRCIAVARQAYDKETYTRSGSHHVVTNLTEALYEIRQASARLGAVSSANKEK